MKRFARPDYNVEPASKRVKARFNLGEIWRAP